MDLEKMEEVNTGLGSNFSLVELSLNKLQMK